MKPTFANVTQGQIKKKKIILFTFATSPFVVLGSHKLSALFPLME